MTEDEFREWAFRISANVTAELEKNLYGMALPIPLKDALRDHNSRVKIRAFYQELWTK